MIYTDTDLAEIPHDRTRLRAYFWRIAQHHKRLAAEHRRDARRASFAEGADLVHWAGVLVDLSTIVLDNLDALVESTYEGPEPGHHLAGSEIADILGVDETTVRRDSAPNGAPVFDNTACGAGMDDGTAPNGAPPAPEPLPPGLTRSTEGKDLTVI